MKDSKIEWCHHTVNFWWGCSKVSEACEHCYAETLDKLRGPRFDGGRLHWGTKARRWDRGERAADELFALDWRAAKSESRERVFINSMSDTFEDHEDLPELRMRLFAAAKIVTALDLLLLTKRPENVRKMVPPAWLEEWPAHVWIGTTVENQKRAEERIPHLLNIPARVRFLSCEPLLDPVDLTAIKCSPDPGFFGDCLMWYHRGDCHKRDGIAYPTVSWVICGGESGPKARPMETAWAESLRLQCAEAGTPFFMKQGSQANWPDFKAFATFPTELQVREFPATI